MSKTATRTAYGKLLLELAGEHPDIVVLTQTWRLLFRSVQSKSSILLSLLNAGSQKPI